MSTLDELRTLLPAGLEATDECLAEEAVPRSQGTSTPVMSMREAVVMPMAHELAAIAVEALTGNLTMNDVEPDVLAAWNDFWRDVVCEDGRLNVAQVARELSDFSVVMHEVSLVYDDVTMGMLSKPNTAHQHVIDRVNELEQEHVDEAVKEAVSESESNLAAALAAKEEAERELVAMECAWESSDRDGFGAWWSETHPWIPSQDGEEPRP